MTTDTSAKDAPACAVTERFALDVEGGHSLDSLMWDLGLFPLYSPPGDVIIPISLAEEGEDGEPEPIELEPPEIIGWTEDPDAPTAFFLLEATWARGHVPTRFVFERTFDPAVSPPAAEWTLPEWATFACPPLCTRVHHRSTGDHG